MTTAEPSASTVVASMSSDPAATPMLAVGAAGDRAAAVGPYDAAPSRRPLSATLLF